MPEKWLKQFFCAESKHILFLQAAEMRYRKLMKILTTSPLTEIDLSATIITTLYNTVINCFRKR